MYPDDCNGHKDEYDYNGGNCTECWCDWSYCSEDEVEFIEDEFDFDDGFIDNAINDPDFYDNSYDSDSDGDGYCDDTFGNPDDNCNCYSSQSRVDGICGDSVVCFNCDDDEPSPGPEDSMNICDPDSSVYSMCGCAESLGNYLCECDPVYCDPVNDPCASSLAEVDECECFGVNYETDEPDPCDINGGAYDVLKCIIKKALEDEEEENTPCVSTDGAKANPLNTIQVLGTINSGISGGLYGNGRGRFHDGVDLEAPVGTPIYSIYDGTVDFSITSHTEGENWDERGTWTGDRNGAGNRVYISSTVDSDNYQFGYWHLSEVETNPNTGEPYKAGDTIAQGDLIGYVGTTGNANSDDSAGPPFTFEGKKKWAKI